MTVERTKRVDVEPTNVTPNDLREREKEIQSTLKTLHVAGSIFAFLAGIIVLTATSPITMVVVGTLGTLAALVGGVALLVLLTRPHYPELKHHIV